MGTLEKLRSRKKEIKEKTTQLVKRSKRADFLRISDLEEGKTVLRVVKHKDDDLPFYLRKTTWLEVDESLENLSRYHLIDTIKENKELMESAGVKDAKELEDVKDDELRDMIRDEMGADFSKIVKKQIFNSKIHGNDEVPDIIEEYIKFASEFFKSETSDIDEYKKKFAPISGHKDGSNKWIPGIMPSEAWVMFVRNWDEERKLSLFEMWGKHMDQIEQLYASFDDPDEPLTIDPFSDSKEGVPIVIDKSKNEKGKFEYAISDKKFTGRGDYSKFLAQFALTKDEVTELDEKEPLSKKYENVYKRRDFELAINGLELFDKKNKLNIFENDQFLEIITPIVEYYDQQTEEGKEEGSESEEVQDQEENTGKDDIDVIDNKPGKVQDQEKYGKTREELKAYIIENELDVTVLKKYSDEEVIEMIKAAEMTESGEVQDDSFSSKEDEPKKSSSRSRNMRDRLKKSEEDKG